MTPLQTSRQRHKTTGAELDRAIRAATRANVRVRETLCRLDRSSRLYCLVPYGPRGRDGVIKVGKCEIRQPALFMDSEGEFVMVYTSFNRAREALKRLGIERQKFPLEVPAHAMIEMLAKLQGRALINIGCRTGTYSLRGD